MLHRTREGNPDGGGLEQHISHKHYPSSSPEPQSAVSLASNQSDRINHTDYSIEMPDAADVEKLAPNASASPPGADDEELFQPKRLKFWLTLLCNFLALFLVALDRTIIATAVPQITDDFHSLGDIGWYGSAYMLTTSCSQLIFGRLYKFYDMKWVFLISVVIFEVGSAICGIAPSSIVFIVGRAIAGLASAGIFSGCMLIMIPMVPLHRRPMFQGMFGMVFGLASVLGPLIGGGFTSGVSWRWCFYINLPIGAVTLVFMIFFWNPPRQKYVPAPFLTHIKRLDPLGMLFFLPSLVSLLLALQWGGSTYKWKNWRIVMLFGIFGVGFLLFMAVQIWKPDTATVPPRVITQRSVAFGTGFTFFLSGSMLILVYFVPIWFQTVQQVIPLKSGIYTMPLVLSLVASSMISGIMTQKIGYYVPAMILAPAIMAVGEGLMTTWVPSTPASQWIGYQFLAGFGLGFGMQTSGLAVQTVLPPGDIPTGVAINFFVQQLGGAVFTSVGQAILSNLLVSQLAGIPDLEPHQIINEGATNLSSVVPPEYFGLVIDAYNYACTRIFIASMGLAFGALICACAMEWRSIKKGKQGPPGGPGGPKGPEVAPPEPSGKSTSSSANLIKSTSDPMPGSSPYPRPVAPVEGRRLSIERQRDAQRRRSSSLKGGMDRRDFIADQRHSRERIEMPISYKRSGEKLDGGSGNRTSSENKIEVIYRPSPNKIVVPTEYQRTVDRAAELPAGRSDIPLDYQRSPLSRVEREFRLSIGRAETSDYPFPSPHTRSADRIDVPPEYRRSAGRVEDWRRSIDHMERPANLKSAEKFDNPAPRSSTDSRRGRAISTTERRRSRDMGIQADLANAEKTATKQSPTKSRAPSTSEKGQSIERQDPARRRSTEGKSMHPERRRSISADRERRRSVLVKRDRRLSSGSNFGNESELDLSSQRLPKLYSNRELPPGSSDAVLGVRNHSYDNLKGQVQGA